MKVQCPNCKRVFWETTDKFHPDITPNGAMLRLLPPWRGNHWPIFGDGVMPTRDGTGTVGTLCAELDCPQCLAQLAPSGRLTVLPDPPEVPPYEMEGAKVEIPDEAEPGDVSLSVNDGPPAKAVAPEPAKTEETGPFACPHCGKEFPTKHRLMGHVGGAHKEGKR